jgi:hypothetical protein
MMKTAMKDLAVRAEQQKIMNNFRDKFIDIHRSEFCLEKLEPILVKVYSCTLSQEDKDGMSAFYRPPVGRSYVSKMPVVIKKTDKCAAKKTG